MRLRPYKSCDAAIIENWIKDEDVFLKWGGNHFGNQLAMVFLSCKEELERYYNASEK